MKSTRHGDRIAALRAAIVETPGDSSRIQRAAAVGGHPTGTPADAYLAKVRTDSVRIVDDDVAMLRRAGLTEDAIFELTLAAAFGEAERRHDDVLGALIRTNDRG